MSRKIRYDYNYKIYTAEECWKTHKGVCQAFSELYVKLAKGCGVEARIIIGKAGCGSREKDGHAWVAAKTEKGTILIEPTWASQAIRSVAQGIDDSLKREEFIMHYFDVKPEAMIFNHFPDRAEDQFLAKPITEEQFCSFPDDFRAELFVYLGVNAKALLSYFLQHPNELPPKGYSENDMQDNIKFIKIPFSRKLYIGKTYTFKIQTTETIHSELEHHEHKWVKNGNVYTFVFRPSSEGRFMIFVKSGNIGHSILYYDVVKP